MSEDEVLSIHAELKAIKESMADMKINVDRLYFRLMGNIDTPGDCGLLAECARRKVDLDAVKAQAEANRVAILALDDWRKKAVSYTAGMIAVIIAVYFVLDRYVNIPKVNLNPNVQKP